LIDWPQRVIMKGCNEFKRMIDEADRPDRLPYEVANHLEACAGCRDFSAARISLRGLLTSMSRVDAPANFNAQLNARLAATRAQRQPFWVTPAIYFRAGALAAGVIVAVFVAQMAGVFSSPAPAPSQLSAGTPPAASPQPEMNRPPAAPPLIAPAQIREQANRPATALAAASSLKQPRRATTVRSDAPGDGFVASEGGVVLVRGQSGERELTVPAVSLGAQPLLYVNAGRQQPQQPRSAGTSF
jgi:hypothetical protein